VIYAARDALLNGQNWFVTSDPAAAGGARLSTANLGAPPPASAAAAYPDYFEVQFSATAGIPYHLWVRGKAEDDSYANDSVFVQFSASVDASGNPILRIGSSSWTKVVLEDCAGCGEQGWGWQDSAYGAFAPPIYFSTTGAQTVRVTRREDGFAIDQIVISAGQYLNAAPGALMNDTTIVPK
jgi:hypothetical protein